MRAICRGQGDDYSSHSLLLFRFIVFSSATDEQTLAASVMFGDKVPPRRFSGLPAQCFPPNFVRPSFLSNCGLRINVVAAACAALAKVTNGCEETLVRPSLPLAAHSLSVCLAFSIVACMSFHGEQRSGAERRGAAPFLCPTERRAN